MLRAMAFVIAPNWKQIKCSSTEKWVNQAWYVHSPYNGILLSNKRKQIVDTCNYLAESQMH